MSDHLFEPVTIGAWELPNRILMAPLTRSRAKQPGDVPWELNAEYYAQRASAGLIIAEATYISVQGRAYAFIPGIANDDHVAGWRRVTDAVHKAGGRIVLQLFHGGRVGHPDLHEGEAPVAPSPLKAETQTYTPESDGMVPVTAPRELRTAELPGIVRAYADAARRAMGAGFDGVEIHGANGYLLDQFSRSGTNRRTDEYGGSVDNRIRFPLEVARAVADAIGPERVGYRVSPSGAFNDMSDSDPVATFTALARGLGGLRLAYLHHVEMGEDTDEIRAVADSMRVAFKDAGGDAFIANAGYTRGSAEERVSSGEADAVAFGTLFLANPDLPERFRRSAPLNEADSSTFYGGDAKGYTDYPSLEDATASA